MRIFTTMFFRPAIWKKIIFAGFFGTLVSCGPNYLLNEKLELEGGIWSYDNNLSYKIDIPDTSTIYNLVIEVEHSMDYPFQNLYTNIYTQFPDGKQLKELISLELANSAGLWAGKCSGGLCRTDISIQQGAFFNQPGAYVFTLEQFMRKDTLNGLNAITFKIEDTGLTR